MDKLRLYFVDIRKQSIAIRFSKLRRANKIAEEMLDHAAPLIDFERSNQLDTDIEKHNFVCLNRDVHSDYFVPLIGRFNRNKPPKP